MAKIIFKDWPGNITRTFNIPDAMLPEIEIDYGNPELTTIPDRVNHVIDAIIAKAVRPIKHRRNAARPEPDISDVINET
jgi:hypothetical protein